MVPNGPKGKRFDESFQKAQDALNAPSPLDEIWKKSAEIRIDPRQTQKLNREMHDMAEANTERHKAILDTAENTGQISKKVESIESALESERDVRKSADDNILRSIETLRKSQRFSNIKALIIGILCAAAGTIFAVIATRYGWL